MFNTLLFLYLPLMLGLLNSAGRKRPAYHDYQRMFITEEHEPSGSY